MAEPKRYLLWIPTLLAIVLGTAFLAAYQPDIPLAELSRKYANENSAFVDVAGMRVHYRDEGNGQIPLVLLHGTGASLHTWDAWTETLGHDFRVIRLDLPGFGLTGPAPSDDYTIQAYVQYLDEFAQALELETFHLAGNSLGGQIAWNYASRHPDRVMRLILLDPAGLPKDQATTTSTVLRLARVPVLNKLLTSMTPRSLVEQSLIEVYADPRKVSPELVDRYFELSRRPGNRQAFVSRALDYALDEDASLAGVSQPTLILWGAEDRWIPVADAQGFADGIKNTRLIIYPGVGHVPMEEHPGPTARAALSFLNN